MIEKRLDENFSNLFRKYGYDPKNDVSKTIFELLQNIDRPVKRSINENRSNTARSTKLNESFERSTLSEATSDSNKRLGNVEGSATQILQSNLSDINSTTSADELNKLLVDLLSDLDTNWTKSFLAKAAKLPYDELLKYVYNSILRGDSGSKTGYYYGEALDESEEDTNFSVSGTINKDAVEETNKSFDESFESDYKNDSGEGYIINPSEDKVGMIAKKRTEIDRGNKPAKIFESYSSEDMIDNLDEFINKWFDYIPDEQYFIDLVKDRWENFNSIDEELNECDSTDTPNNIAEGIGDSINKVANKIHDTTGLPVGKKYYVKDDTGKTKSFTDKDEADRYSKNINKFNVRKSDVKEVSNKKMSDAKKNFKRDSREYSELDPMKDGIGYDLSKSAASDRWSKNKPQWKDYDPTNESLNARPLSKEKLKKIWSMSDEDYDEIARAKN